MTVKKPLFSIVTVVFNAKEIIEQTILSVINQNFADKEFIIIDGGSTDGTLEIIEKYKDKIDFFCSEPDRGIFDAMNKGILMCTGQYLGFLNAGDFYEDDILLKLSEKVKHYKEIGVFYGKTNLLINLKSSAYSLEIVPNSNVNEKIFISPMFCHQSSFVQRNLFEEVGYFDDVGVAGDWLFFVKLFKKNVPFRYLNLTIANYLEGGASTTTAGFKESFKYKKQFNTFGFRDHLQLIWFRIKNFKPTKTLLHFIMWKLKINIYRNRFKKLK